MDIVIIGTGNTATVLGKKMKVAGHSILQVAGRNAGAASALARQLGADSTANWPLVNQQAAVYLLAVSDSAVVDVAKDLPLGGKIVAHTAASVSLNVLAEVTPRAGVFYPLQSLNKSIETLPDIPIVVDAVDGETLRVLTELAHSISGSVSLAGDEQRLKLHLAAAVANNFTNHLYALVEDYCRKEGLNFSLLYPLIRQTAARIEHVSPAESQTGPAARKDWGTVQKHEALLHRYPRLQKLYQMFSASIGQGSS